jgi:hypothetical protein
LTSPKHSPAAGSQPRWARLPFQFLLVSPVLAPVWVGGLIALWHRPSLRPYRLFAVAWLVLIAVSLVTGGKPCYHRPCPQPDYAIPVCL